MPESAVRTNSWLCNYAICQIGKPYWYGTYGQISSTELYRDTVSPAIISDLGEYSLYTDYMDQLHEKVHDCSGLVLGAMVCESVGGEPTLPIPDWNDVAHGSNSQYNVNCSVKSDSMSDFPYIPGTLVFKTSGGVRTHVGIYVGSFIDLDGNAHEDEVVEAMGHAYGVTTTKIYNEKWDSWGQLDYCTVDTKKGMSFDARSASVGSMGTFNVNPENMTPFVATIAQSYNPTLDYEQIKSARISAMAFFGGELFDSYHNKRTYINPYLDNQVQQCNLGGLPYMLYVNVRASSEIEADAECKALYYVLAQYPPKLGLWLCLKTHNHVEMNDKIIEVYYRYIEKWGLKGKCGLYLDKAQLSDITWTSFQERFNLWLIDPKDVTTVDNELLQPEMFEVAD